MSASFDDMMTSDELLDIKPDISVLCRHTSTSNSVCLDIKPDSSHDCPSATSSQQLDVQSAICKTETCEEQFDLKTHACVLCENLQLAICDQQLHQIPLVLMDEFDITKLVYPIISVPQQNNVDANVITNDDLCDKPYICIDCGYQLGSIVLYKIHALCHSREKSFLCNICHQQFRSRKQLLAHSTARCPGRSDFCFCVDLSCL